MASAKLEPDPRPEYNILLLWHETLADAIESPVSVVIQVQFTITDDEDKVLIVKEGIKDGNEYLDNTAHSSTAKCRSYLIDFDSFRVRLIDSPGVGSTVIENDSNKDQFDKHSKGVEQDEKYVEEVLEFISHFKHLHAIAIVVKSNETRYTTRFELCLKQLLSRFNKSAIDNLFFILTFGESTRFKTDIVKQPLKTLLEKATSDTSATSDELMSKNKVYSVDNRGFRYLLAVKNGACFTPLEKSVSENAWTKSRNECKRLIDYITGQGDQRQPAPHKVTDTLSINEARKFISIVKKLMEDILKVIDHNRQALEECLASSTKEEDQIAQYEKRLNEKQQDVEIIKVKLPQTICTSSKCAEVLDVDGENKTHYSNICCEGCRVTIMRRLFCQAIELKSGNCKVCKCEVAYHRRNYFTTKIVSKDRKDKDAIIKEMKSATDNKQKIEIAKKHNELQLKQIHNEKMVIENAQNIFKDFLKTNPIIPCESTNGSVADVISPDDVFVLKNELLNLEKFGPAIQAAYGIAKQGEEEDWLANKLDSTKEKLISVKNTFSKWYHKQPDSGESTVQQSTGIVPVSLKDNSGNQ